MVDPISFAAVTLLVKTASIWFPPIRDAFLNKAMDKGAEYAIDKSMKGVHSLLHLDEKEQVKHLELALKNAVERGLAKFYTPEEQQHYLSILSFLSESDSQSETLRREAMQLFTLSDTPKLAELNKNYNHSLLSSSQMQSVTPYAFVDAGPYLSSFFDALIAELYNDPFFRPQMSDVLQVRTAISVHRTLTEVVETLRQINGALINGYTTEQFERDVEAYVTHMERTLRYLKLTGEVPKGRSSDENKDPELDGIFVPLRITLLNASTPNLRDHGGKTSLKPPDRPKEKDSYFAEIPWKHIDQRMFGGQTPDSIIRLLDNISYLVLLGGPGSGKSTATRHLAWSHAFANLSTSSSLSNIPLLSGKPVPLRIELRRLTEDRRQRPNYDFLTYASEVLLGRAGLNIPSHMFELLLERRMMLILFDGLDEVPTLDDRRTLVDEIEGFTQRYPGNRFIVTSRPVGYDLANLTDRLFAHADIQTFDNEQIHIFLERWYTYVLRLSILTRDDQQELESLFTTLKENPRLHMLAENPLLLTVITALHRYERLPDKRILVYDRCADLLLDTWSKLRGTNVRWKNLKMSKEDQYACVAHLGFILHERSQEKQEDKAGSEETSPSRDPATDVPLRFMLREIERFLRSQNLYPSIAEQNVQAMRFFELMQEEAGLIVEHGIGEDSEPVYGFVHRTFQEYFAAAAVFERYQQEEDATIISKFVKEHLHDPHWHEVLLLLLGKLKRKPATTQLRQILSGKSHLSRYVDIVQQDLFFVCTCLNEEIGVDNELAGDIVSRLSALIKGSPFPSQRAEAWEVFDSLMRTRQYASLARSNLVKLLTHDTIPDTLLRIRIAQMFYFHSPPKSEERHLGVQILSNLTQQTDLSNEESIQIAEALYLCSSDEAQRQRALQLLSNLAPRPGSDSVEVHFLSELSASSKLWQEIQQQQLARPWKTLQEQLAVFFAGHALHQLTWQHFQHDGVLITSLETALQQALLYLNLPLLSDISSVGIVKKIEALYQKSSDQPEVAQRTAQIIWQLAQNEELTVDQRLQIATIPLRVGDANYPNITKAVHIVLTILRSEDARQYLEKQWPDRDFFNIATVSDIPYIVELAKQESLPTEARDQMFRILSQMVPQFGNVVETEN